MGTIAHQAKNAVHNHCVPPPPPAPKKQKQQQTITKKIKGQNPYLNLNLTMSLNKTSTMPIFVVFRLIDYNHLIYVVCYAIIEKKIILFDLLFDSNKKILECRLTLIMLGMLK